MHITRYLPGGFLLLFAISILISCSQDSENNQEQVSPDPVSSELIRQLPPAPQEIVSLTDHVRLVNAENEPHNWLLHGRTFDEQRYSPLEKINADNVTQLDLAWHYDFDTKRGLEASPIIIDGVMYASGSWSRVYAFNAVNGELLWEYNPDVPGAWAVNACCDVVNRGVAVSGNKVVVGTIDGRLIALDKENGSVIWETQTTDPNKRYSITGAPRIVRDKVFIGNGGAEFGVRGYISAYDLNSGEMVWRFYTVPGNPEFGFETYTVEKIAETWNGEWWVLGGGGTVWDSMAYDPELDLLYFGVGNGSPWNQKLRSPGGGDNLFLASIVAVKPDTGEYVWHYQTVPGETWDYTATQHIMLADLVINNEERKVLMQAPKNGFFYVIDRETGELISVEAFVPVNWATHVDLETGRPVENPQARYYNELAPQFITPMWLGGHNWHPMAFNPETGLVYIPAQEMGFPYAPTETLDIKAMAANLGADFSGAAMPDDPGAQDAILAEVKGHLAAWDPVAQEERWRIQHPGPWNGGILSTAGNLIFQGNAAGFFTAYRADNGDKLWSFPAQTGVVAPPVTYEVDGEQYVSVLAGWGGIFPLISGRMSFKSGPQTNRSRLLTFKLRGTDALPELIPEDPVKVDLSSIVINEEDIPAGAGHYGDYCGNCHGGDAFGGGVIPDLRYSPMLSSIEAWNSVVIGGALENNGMASYDAVLSNEQSAAIYHYVVSQALKIRD